MRTGTVLRAVGPTPRQMRAGPRHPGGVRCASMKAVKAVAAPAGVAAGVVGLRGGSRRGEPVGHRQAPTARRLPEVCGLRRGRVRLFWWGAPPSDLIAAGPTMSGRSSTATTWCCQDRWSGRDQHPGGTPITTGETGVMTHASAESARRSARPRCLAVLRTLHRDQKRRCTAW